MLVFRIPRKHETRKQSQAGKHSSYNTIYSKSIKIVRIKLNFMEVNEIVVNTSRAYPKPLVRYRKDNI